MAVEIVKGDKLVILKINDAENKLRNTDMNNML